MQLMFGNYLRGLVDRTWEYRVESSFELIQLADKVERHGDLAYGTEYSAHRLDEVQPAGGATHLWDALGSAVGALEVYNWYRMAMTMDDRKWCSLS
jgi:hypothetical protein